MELTKPDFVEIKMDAEISSYQESDDPTRDPQFVRAHANDAKAPEEGDRARS
jgi:hypothetical protein